MPPLILAPGNYSPYSPKSAASAHFQPRMGRTYIVQAGTDRLCIFSLHRDKYRCQCKGLSSRSIGHRAFVDNLSRAILQLPYHGVKPKLQHPRDAGRLSRQAHHSIYHSLADKRMELPTSTKGASCLFTYWCQDSDRSQHSIFWRLLHIS